MKIFKILTVALVAMLGFTACDKECGHDFIEVDYSADLVGTWTCLEADLAQAFVFNADGTATTTGVENGKYWENVNVTWKLKNNKLTLSYGDNTSETLINIVSGKILSIADKNGDNRRTFQYCANDLSDEIVGMWVCTQGVFGNEEESTIIVTYKDNGKAYLSGFLPETNGYVNQIESNYKVIGNMIFSSVEDGTRYLIKEIDIIPNGTELGDIMTTYDLATGTNPSYLRIKQHLELPGMKYDYIKTFVSNVKGADKDIPFLNTSFNFAKMDGGIIDKFLKSILFTVEFPEANKIKYSYLLEGMNIVMEAPIEVDGNKMAIKMSEFNPVYHDVEVYTFQDQDNTQMHMYMHTTDFEKFFANTSVAVMLGHGQLSQDDTEAIAGVYQTIADAVESINLSLVMTKVVIK